MVYFPTESPLVVVVMSPVVVMCPPGCVGVVVGLWRCMTLCVVPVHKWGLWQKKIDRVLATYTLRCQ